MNHIFYFYKKIIPKATYLCLLGFSCHQAQVYQGNDEVSDAKSLENTKYANSFQLRTSAYSIQRQSN